MIGRQAHGFEVHDLIDNPSTGSGVKIPKGLLGGMKSDT